jgi:hypothetical protein
MPEQDGASRTPIEDEIRRREAQARALLGPIRHERRFADMAEKHEQTPELSKAGATIHHIRDFTPKPAYTEPDFASIPDELKLMGNWVCWRGEQPKPGKTKWRKVPYVAQSGGAPAKINDKSTWRSFDRAVEAFRVSRRWARPFDGIGFVFDGAVGEDGLVYCGIDLDEWTEAAQTICAKLASYAELSPSGAGVHVIARAAPFEQATCKTEALSCEVYCAGRYFTFTGKLLNDAPAPIEARANEVAEVVSLAPGSPTKTDQTPEKGKSYRRQLRNGVARREAKRQSTAEQAAPDEDLDDLRAGVGGLRQPVEMEKFKSALWALTNEWMADEGHWTNLCVACANEAMRAGGTPEAVDAFWTVLDERSYGCDGYDQAENSRRFQRFLSDYGKRLSPLTAASLYWWAREQGWDEAASPQAHDPEAGDAGRAGARLRGGSLYAMAHNLLRRSGCKFAYDEMHDVCLVDGVALTDHVVGSLRAYCINAAADHRDPKAACVREVAERLCSLNPFDPEKDWLNSLEWDGVPRLDAWLIEHIGAIDTPLNRAIGREFLIGKVMRGLFPGCKFDTALIIEAPTGWGKSELARLLAGSDDKFSDMPIIHEKSKEQQELLNGVTVVELGEVSDLKRGDINVIKAFISRRFDIARPAYAHSLRKQPRRNVFAGTTEESKYLQDEDNRRFWCVRAGKTIDHEEFKAAWEQLHAEAVQAVVRDGETPVPQTLRQPEPARLLSRNPRRAAELSRGGLVRRRVAERRVPPHAG